MKKKVLLTFVAVLAVAFLFHPFLLEGIAHWLIVQDKLKPADVIVVLAGDFNGERVDQGIKLYKRGYAPKMLMSGGQLAWHLTNSEWMKKQAVTLGVPAGVILEQNKSLSTIQDARFTLPILKKINVRSIILVTSPTHTRRARGVFRKVLMPAGIEVISWPVEESKFKVNRWWTRHEDIQLVMTELMSSVFYWKLLYN